MDILEAFLDALYPKNIKCLLCDAELKRGERDICSQCEGQLEGANDRDIGGLSGFTAGLAYTGVIRAAVHRLKYGGETYLAEFLAGFIEVGEDWHIDVIVPVPLHKRKRRLRGYNQSEFLAEELSRRLNVPVDDGLLIRVRNTRTQTRFKKARRMHNLEGAFRASPRCAGIRVLLVDDVCTTGSTLGECASALRAAGAKAVYAAAACSVE